MCLGGLNDTNFTFLNGMWYCFYSSKYLSIRIEAVWPTPSNEDPQHILECPSCNITKEKYALSIYNI